MFRFGSLFSIIFLCAISFFGQTDENLKEAHRLYSDKKYVEAAAAYQNLLDKTLDAPIKAEIIFHLGMTYQRLKQYDRAIEFFRQIFEIKVDEQESRGKNLQVNRYRSSAQWEIGNSLFAKGDYEGALNAYRTTREKYSLQTGCGTCQAEIEKRYILYQGICLEHLGRYEEAVNLYLKIYEPRLAEIYNAAGQLDDLKAMISKRDEKVIAERMQKYAWTREHASKYLETELLNEAIKIYDLEKAKDWKGLINSAVRFAPLDRNGRGNPAVKSLARHPKEVFPLIKQELETTNERVSTFLFYQILGLSATDDSIAFLKDLAIKQPNWWHVAEIVKALKSAGEKGEKVLLELEPTAKANLKLAIERSRTGELEMESANEIKFPTIKIKSGLPTNLR